MATSVSHVHEFGRAVHVDHCHYVLVVKRCKECGDVHEVPSQRNFVLNPLQVVFAREDCVSCRARVSDANLWPASWAT
jgi:hypothetical protein